MFTMTKKRGAEDQPHQEGALTTRSAKEKKKGNQVAAAKLERFAHTASQSPTKGGLSPPATQATQAKAQAGSSAARKRQKSKSTNTIGAKTASTKGPGGEMPETVSLSVTPVLSESATVADPELVEEPTLRDERSMLVRILLLVLITN